MKQAVKKFNNLIKKTIFKVKNKTNDKLLLFKTEKNANNKLLISKFNKFIITLISLLFFYLFYLSIPVLYGKNWVQKNIENQLLKDFKIHFSLSSDISYRILPSPHYLVKDSKILKEDNKTVSLAEIKTLKIFISQSNFFDKSKLLLRHIKLDKVNFILLANDLRMLKNSANKKLSNKKIEIKNSNIFFKNNLNETVSIIKISDASLLRDDEKLLNLINLKGNIFNIPFRLDYSRNFDYLNNEEINFVVKKLKLDIFNTRTFPENNDSTGENVISFLNSKIITNYKIKDGIMIFNSVNSKIKNSKVNYKGKMEVNPFDLNLNIHLDSYNLFKFFNPDSILNELIKTKLLFNKNISVSTSITKSTNSNNKLFQNAKINFNIVDGKLNINKTRLINEKIGLLELNDSNISFENDKLILNTNVIISIKNSDKLFSLLQTNKKFRKPIKNIFINLDYDLLFNNINFNNIKINNKKINNESLRIIENFNDSEINWNKSKRVLNNFFENYEG